MKKILVPCDFSAAARQAYKFAVELAAASEGEIFVMHAITFPIIYETTFGVQPYQLNEEEVKKMADNAKDTFERMKQAHPAPSNVPVSFYTLHDYLLPSIRSFAEQKKIDLIVMGTSGSSGLEEVFIGSNTEKVVRFATIPVIAIRKAPFFSSVRNIVFPNTMELNQTELMLRIKKLQKFFNATLHLLVINTPTHFLQDQEAKKAMDEFAKHYQLDNYTTNFRSNTHARDGILDFVSEIKADMLAMGTHGRRGIAHMFFDSLTEAVVNRVDCPIWTYSWRP
jgi:nucleotide-binding universal stress UspA family protein